MLTCSVCDQLYGAAFQCSAGSKCYTAFHPLCARLAGLPMLEVDDADTSTLTALRKKIARHGATRDAPTSAALGKEGTRLAGGLRLLAFCSKHRECANIRRPSAVRGPCAAADVPGARVHVGCGCEQFVR